jgi:cell division protein FtsW (lipid II flippase)
MAIPVLWHEIERLQYVLLRLFAFLGTGDAREDVSYQLKQSLLAVGPAGGSARGSGRGGSSTASSRSPTPTSSAATSARSGASSGWWG